MQDDREAITEGWLSCRDRLLADHSRTPGSRPYGFWIVESGIFVDLDTSLGRIDAALGMVESDWLDERDLLTEAERRALAEPGWRDYWDKRREALRSHETI